MIKINNISISEFKIQMMNKIDISQGNIVNKYNITLGILERYFIPALEFPAFVFARSKQDLSAYKKFGIRIN